MEIITIASDTTERKVSEEHMPSFYELWKINFIISSLQIRPFKNQ